MSGTEGAKMTKGKEVSRERAQEGGSLGLATIAVIGTWGQGAQWRSSSQTSTPGWGGGAGAGTGNGNSVHVDPCLLKLVTARSFCLLREWTNDKSPTHSTETVRYGAGTRLKNPFAPHNSPC